MNYTQRFYQSDADYTAMRQLIIESYAATTPHHYMTPGDLDWWCGLKEDPAAFLPTVPLWFADARLVGFLWPAPGNADLLVHPAHRNVEPELLDWAITNLLAPGKDNEPPTLTVWSLETDTYRNDLLAAAGFAPGPEFYTSFLWELTAPPPAPTLPPGYTLRSFAGETEIEERVAVHRSAFHPSKMTVAKHRRVMHSPTYRSDFDLVVIAPDASLAAYAIVWYDPINFCGLFEPVGVHAHHRRKGLGSAVLYAGLQQLQALGAQRAHVLSWSDDSEGAHLYQHTGFVMIDRYRGLKKFFERNSKHESQSTG